MDDDPYDIWFVEQNGPRPHVDREAVERARTMRAELATLDEMIDRQREWIARYLAGRQALQKFGRR